MAEDRSVRTAHYPQRVRNFESFCKEVHQFLRRVTIQRKEYRPDPHDESVFGRSNVQHD